jgi:hypothetical protein
MVGYACKSSLCAIISDWFIWNYRDPGQNAKSVAEMIAEFLREAAVLTAVFVPLNRIVTGRENLTERWCF